MFKCNNSGSFIALCTAIGVSIGAALGYIAIGAIVGFVIGLIITQLRGKSTTP